VLDHNVRLMAEAATNEDDDDDDDDDDTAGLAEQKRFVVSLAQRLISCASCCVALVPTSRNCSLPTGSSRKSSFAVVGNMCRRGSRQNVFENCTGDWRNSYACEEG
jgi:hypothetical protein